MLYHKRRYQFDHEPVHWPKAQAYYNLRTPSASPTIDLATSTIPPVPVDKQSLADQIIQAKNVDELLKLYEARGQRFESLAKFREQVKADWARHGPQWVEEQEKKASKARDRFSFRETIVGNVSYRLLGIVHHPDESEYNNRLFEKVRSLRGSKLVYEENLRRYIPDGLGWELGDRIFLRGGRFLEGVTLIFKLARNFMHYQEIESAAKWGRNIPQAALIEAIGLCVELPCRLSLDFKQKLNESLDSSQLRSAYMAEVLRRLDHTGPRYAVVGAAHVAEIEYFLENGIQNKKVIATAAKHAELINQGELVPTLLCTQAGWLGLNLAVLTIVYTILGAASGLVSGISWVLKQVF